MSTAALVAVLLRNRAGAGTGIAAVCSAHPLVLDAALHHARRNDSLVLVEATCNQVNQDGGYTGLTPAAFRDDLRARALAASLAEENLILGGDHLGPNPWKARPAAEAMERACELTAAFARAGYGKLHLDASMACADDPSPLPPDVIANRAAHLAAAAESAAVSAQRPPPVYVIGTEVPTPGGATEALDHLAVTRADDVADTLELHRRAFAARGVQAAFERVIAVVVQPGVEFGQDEVHEYRPAAASGLKAALGPQPHLVFEAHSTDYQPLPALAALIRDHFAILKVGPELTFALREALFGLSAVAAELGLEPRLRIALNQAMDDDPRWWRGYAAPSDTAGRLFGRSDRVRYYWPVPGVAAAVDEMLARLTQARIPRGLLAQYMPGADPGGTPAAFIRSRIDAVLDRYAAAISAR